MSQNERSQDVLKPTGLEVYNDAARILEELLKQRIDDNLHVPYKVRRNKTDPKSGRVITSNVGSENVVVRNKIMPSRNTKSLDERLSMKDLNSLLEKANQQQNKSEHRVGSESSIDTDDDQAEVSEKRKKKSIFKRAKERFLHTFHHDQKEEFGKATDKSNNDLPSKRQILKNKQMEDMNKAYVHMKVNVGDNKPTKHIETQSNENIKHSEEYAVLKGKVSVSVPTSRGKKSSTAEGNTYSQDVKKGHPFGSLKDTDGKPLPSTGSHQGSDKMCDMPQPSGKIIRTVGINPPALESEINSSMLPPPPPPAYHQGSSKDHAIDVTYIPQSSLSSPVCLSYRNTSPPLKTRSPQSRSPSPSSKSLTTVLEPGTITGATSTSSCKILLPEKTSDGSAATVLSIGPSSILDSPGEDIEYMDIDTSVSSNRNSKAGRGDQTGSMHSEVLNFNGNEGMLGLSRLTGQPSDSIHSLDLEVVQRVTSTRGPAGNVETTSSVSSLGTVIIPRVHGEAQYEKRIIQSQKSSIDKEALYGRIAQKLIEMGDYYSASASDQELAGAAAIQPSSVTDLEMEIIACLRTGGDRNSKQLEESFEEFTQQTTQEAYERFHSTMQNSMGNDLTWDHLALLFYTTKGVVSAVGKGSRKANQAKEFTLQYVTDTFASWIMDQGGFDSVLSSEESDFDVD